MQVYLDHHAATPVHPSVRAALLALDGEAWANPSSVHAAGRASRAHLERAREQIAQAIGARAADIVLTAGGTEACNLAVLGTLAALERAAVVTTAVEHPAVSAPLAALVARGQIALERLPVPHGLAPTPAAFAAALSGDTRLAAFQWVNHETGTIFPVHDYARACRAAGVLSFIDATQALGKLPLDVNALDADLVALAAHKIGGTAGAGALWVRRGLDLHSLVLGGGQERGRRAGTPDVRALLAFGVACSLLPERLAAQGRVEALRDRLEAALLSLGGVRNAASGARVGTVANLWFPGRRADALVAALDLEGLAVSAGAACSSGKSEPSPVLLAMHLEEPARSEASLRFSFGPELSDNDIDFTIDVCRRVLARPPA
jgi:cysteine desulfurase